MGMFQTTQQERTNRDGAGRSNQIQADWNQSLQMLTDKWAELKGKIFLAIAEEANALREE